MTQTDSPYGQTMTNPFSDAKFLGSFSNSKNNQRIWHFYPQKRLEKTQIVVLRSALILSELIGSLAAASIVVAWGAHSLIRLNIYGG